MGWKGSSPKTQFYSVADFKFNQLGDRDKSIILEAVGTASEWLDKTTASEASAEEVEDQLAGLCSNFLRKYSPTELSVQP